MPMKEPTRDETEFRHAEIDAFVKRYGLEGFADLLAWLLTTIRGMISKGEIPATEKGVMEAMAFIVGKHPEIDQYLRKFSMATTQEMVNEMKQIKRPN